MIRLPKLPLLVLAVSGCAAITRPPSDVPTIERSADAARATERATTDTLIERLAQRAAKRRDGTIDILMLSGGGQNGAYGIGFLRGWKARSDGSWPTFDLVTGISTGALQAPFALLGTDAALDTAAAIYRRSAERIAPTPDYFFWLRRTGGLVNTSRYRASIANVLDTTFAARMRTAFADGQQMAIATTDFDLGIGHTWDVRRELGVDTSGMSRVHSLLVAATAIPAIFPPVVIDDHVHADGGVIANVLPVLDLDGYKRLRARLTALGVASPVKVRVYVVLNLWSHIVPFVTDPASRGGMKSRSDGILFFATQPMILDRLSLLGKVVTAEVPGMTVEVRETAIPAELATDPGAAKLFDSAWMLKLEEIGYARGKSASPWDTIASPYERPRPRTP